MTQIGEGVALAFDAEQTSAPGTLTVIVRERSSEEPVAGVTVALRGPSSGTATTDTGGQARFSGLTAGGYTVTLTQDEFELSPSHVAASVGSGEHAREELSIDRIIRTVVIKRIHLRGVVRAAVGDKSELEYGHWWIEMDGSESYGWWPAEGVSISGTFRGVPGSLNGQGPRFRGTPTRDPHHGDRAEEMFHPRILNGQPAAGIKSCIRGFARGYHGTWSWPWGQNCHSFQEDMMEHCGLSKAGGKKAS
ncbi:MAG: carboxypeptidase-like regulatory domain-containing protein [Gemmatimonadales bacterium]